MLAEQSVVDSGLRRWPVRYLIVAVVLMVILHGFFLVIGSRVFTPDSFAVDIGTFLIDLVVILYLNSKYPLSFFHVDRLEKVLLYGLGWGLLPLGIFIYQIATQTFTAPADYARFHQFTAFEKGMFFMLNTALPAFFEETLFRGYFYRILRNSYAVFWGVAISTLFFTAAHGFQLPIIFQGLLYAYVYEKTGSIWGSSLTHFMNNSIWFFLAYSVAR